MEPEGEEIEEPDSEKCICSQSSAVPRMPEAQISSGISKWLRNVPANY